MINKRSSKAFSLIELSIVVLVIGILIAGVIQGRDLVSKSQLRTARNLTISSPVSGVKDLALWYETSLESSFKTTEAVDNTAIGTWYDNNVQKTSKNNATQGTAGNKPKFYDNVFGGIPAIRFDGTDDRLTYDGSFLATVGYTIFVVEQRRSSAAKYFLEGDGGSDNANLLLGYESSSGITQAQWNNDLDFPVTAFSSPTPAMHTFWLSKTAGKKYWLNGGISPDDSEPTQTTTLISYSGAMVGGSATNPYNGDIAEIIMFTRDLKDEERRAIESYLSRKYKIGITG